MKLLKLRGVQTVKIYGENGEDLGELTVVERHHSWVKLGFVGPLAFVAKKLENNSETNIAVPDKKIST